MKTKILADFQIYISVPLTGGDYICTDTAVLWILQVLALSKQFE